MKTTLLLLPDFAMLFFGLLLRRFLHASDEVWSGIEKLVFYVFFPALLFYALSRATFDFSTTFTLACAALALVSLGIVLSLPPRWLFSLPVMQFSSIFQCGFRFNSYIGLSTAAALFGQSGVALMGLIIGITVPIANVTAVWMFARHAERGIWRELARNPLIWGSLAGLIANVVGFHPIPPLSVFLERLSQLAVNLGLLTVGAALKFKGDSYIRGASPYFLILKLVIFPVLAFFIGKLLHLEHLPFQVLVLYASLPTASSAYIMAVHMGGDGKSVAWLISVGTFFAMMTMPLWVANLVH